MTGALPLSAPEACLALHLRAEASVRLARLVLGSQALLLTPALPGRIAPAKAALRG